jgi:hypothetical protein
LARRYKKKLGMSIGAGTFTPAWVYTAGSPRFNFNKLLQDGTTTPQVMPLPWDSVFQAKWSVLVQEFGRRYNGTPEVAYITMGGLGRQLETFFVDSPEDIATFTVNNGLNNWYGAGVKVAGFYATSFPNTRFLYALGAPTPTTEGRAMLDQLVNSCSSLYPARFGVRSDGLRSQMGLQDPIGLTIQRLSPTTTAGFQMLLPFKGGQTSLTGTLSDALNVAIQFKAHFVEVYSGDCSDSTQQTALKQANPKLIRNAWITQR